MNKLTKLIIPVTVLGALLVISSLVNSQQSGRAAPSGPTVTIDQSQLPLPVIGSTAITGTVAIGNTAESPLFVRDVDNPARHPFAIFMTDSQIFRVPNNQRYVVEHYAADCNVDTTGIQTNLKLRVIQANFNEIADNAVPHFVQSNGFIDGHAVVFWRASGTTCG